VKRFIAKLAISLGEVNAVGNKTPQTWEEFVKNFQEFKTPSGRLLFLIGEAERHGVDIVIKQDGPAVIEDRGREVLLFLPQLPYIRFTKNSDGKSLKVEVV
jgi:predicted ATP-grasp superfamily ATP-dependent carboligase